MIFLIVSEIYKRLSGAGLTHTQTIKTAPLNPNCFTLIRDFDLTLLYIYSKYEGCKSNSIGEYLTLTCDLL